MMHEKIDEDEQGIVVDKETIQKSDESNVTDETQQSAVEISDSVQPDQEWTYR